MIQPLWRTVWRFLKKWKIELPYDPAIPLLGIYPEKTIIQKDTCTPVFITALFTIGRTWKQPKSPSTDEWIKKMWYIYTMEHYSAIKKNEIMPFAVTWVDPEIVILSEVSQTEKDKYHMISLICGIFKKGTNELIYKTKRVTHVKINLWLPGDKGGGRINWKIGIDTYTLLYIK